MNILSSIKKQKNLKEEKAKSDYWKIMIIDEDLEKHKAMHLALEDVTFDDKPLRIISTRTWEEAKPLISNNPDTALLLSSIKEVNKYKVFSLIIHIR